MYTHYRSYCGGVHSLDRCTNVVLNELHICSLERRGTTFRNQHSTYYCYDRAVYCVQWYVSAHRA